MLDLKITLLMLVDNYNHYWAWYKKLRKNYGVYTSLSCAWYNHKHYDIDGNYK